MSRLEFIRRDASIIQPQAGFVRFRPVAADALAGQDRLHVAGEVNIAAKNRTRRRRNSRAHDYDGRDRRPESVTSSEA
jgi:hypothetical protein